MIKTTDPDGYAIGIWCGERRQVGSLVVLVLASLVLGCATQPSVPGFLSGDPPGFAMALLHGLIAPFALVGSVFAEVRIYAFPNSGLFYDLGFLLGLSAWGGGTTYAVRR